MSYEEIIEKIKNGEYIDTDEIKQFLVDKSNEIPGAAQIYTKALVRAKQETAAVKEMYKGMEALGAVEALPHIAMILAHSKQIEKHIIYIIQAAQNVDAYMSNTLTDTLKTLDGESYDEEDN